MKKKLITIALCMIMLTGCGDVKPTVEPTTFVPVEHEDTQINIFKDSILDYSVVSSILEDYTDCSILLQNTDSTYTVFCKRPSNCTDINQYTPSDTVELSDEDANSLTYFSKTVGHENLGETKFRCSVRYNANNEISCIVLDFYTMKGVDK